jgi:hypothetical protein
MAERKGDDLSATGTHRAGNRDNERNWLERAQPANPRHAAITRSLYSWSNYKNWTDKVRNNWDKDKDKGGGGK